MKLFKFTYLAAVLALFCSGQASAVDPIVDNFTGASANNSWVPLGYACLTAGDNSGSIPKCASPNDSLGSGALRLTPAEQNKTGAILSDFNFPISQGLQVTFTTYTYGGSGADGINFFLTDGTKPIPLKTGTPGGSLGYSCSNYKGSNEGGPDGIANGYLGLGIDEYGNYLNGASSHAANDNTATGIGFSENTIGLRGAGNVAWDALSAEYPTYYPSTLAASKQQEAVNNTCKTGYLWDYSDPTTPSKTTQTLMDYPLIPGGYKKLTESIGSNATERKNAIPISYKLTLTPAGYLSLLYSYNNGNYQPVLINQDISSSNGPIPASFRFGFSGSTGGSTNIHEITCFNASPIQSSSSVGANTIQSGEVKTGTQIYLAYYNPNNWWGSLVSEPLVFSSGALTASSVANWDASCVLTGGDCPKMGTDANGNALTNITVQAPTDRTMLTWNGSKGIPFEWSNLTSGQQAILNNNPTDGLGSDRLSWLRGNRTQEQEATPPGSLRTRTSVLGDIIDSSPVVVGSPSATALPSVWADALYPTSTPPENGATTGYSQFVSDNATRENIVYTGSNDGLVHGFRSGSYNADGTYNSTNNDGKEVLAFMPASVLANTNVVDLTSPTYGHHYFVDASPVAGDLYYGGAWHTWLVGGLGMGGKEIYALDITDPSAFSETNAANLVKGDWTNASAGLSHLGNTTGTPIITRLHNGDWAFIFGNGLNSGTSAGVYIGLVNSTTGAVTFKFLDTGVGSSATFNGISSVAYADLDDDHVADYIYAGDQLGNLWRFNVTSSNPSDWAVSKFGKTNPTPLFVAKNGNNLQPIATAPAIASVKVDNENRVIVLFGTGQKTPATSLAGDTYASGTQTFYGIWDWNMGDWDNGTTTTAGVTIPAATTQYASLSAPQTLARTVLLGQSVAPTTTATTSGSIKGYRSVSATNQVCWKGTKTCGNSTNANNQFGWYFDFPGAQEEQIIYNPTIVGNAVLVNTAIPPMISANECNPGVQTGWSMAFDIASGGGLTEGFFPDATGSYQKAADGSTVAGVQLNGVGTPYVVTVNGLPYLITQTSGGNAAITKINPQNLNAKQRISWRELVN